MDFDHMGFQTIRMEHIHTAEDVAVGGSSMAAVDLSVDAAVNAAVDSSADSFADSFVDSSN